MSDTSSLDERVAQWLADNAWEPTEPELTTIRVLATIGRGLVQLQRIRIEGLRRELANTREELFRWEMGEFEEPDNG